MADLFKEILPSILQTKEYALLTDQDEKSYPAFMVNRALSYYKDTVLIANQMNEFHNVDNKLKYDFLFHVIRPAKRYSKWHKPEVNEYVELLKEYYQCSDSKAIEFLKILNKKQLDMIKQELYKGG